MEFQILVFIVCVILNPAKSKPATPKVAAIDDEQAEVPRCDKRFLLPNNDNTHIYRARTRNDTYEQEAAVQRCYKKFLLPKTLNKNDNISIYGIRTRNDTWLKISLTEGIDKPDTENVPFFIMLDYTVGNKESFMMGSIYKGKYSKQGEDEKASDYTEEKFELVLRFEENAVHSVLNNSSLKTKTFENKLKDISFLVVEGNFDVNKLIFTFG